MYNIGFDLGSSSINGSIVDSNSGKELITLNEPKEYNLTLKDEGYFRGEVISSADNALIQDSAIEILFESEENLFNDTKYRLPIVLKYIKSNYSFHSKFKFWTFVKINY